MNNSETDTSPAGLAEVVAALEESIKKLEALVMMHNTLSLMTLIERTKRKFMMILSKPLLDKAIQICQDEATRRWLTHNSASFFQLADMFQLLKEKVDEKEKKNHGDTVDIIFVAHGSIRLPMIPASCLLPRSSITDLVLYSPWICVTDSNVIYSIATGKIRPEHRDFYGRKNKSFLIPDKSHRPTKLPNHWNSLKKAGAQNIPTITVSPLEPEDGVWEAYKSLTAQHGPPGRNRIVIPFLRPRDKPLGSSESVPVYVVTLALSLVLLSSRFKATVHLTACLGDQTGGLKVHEESLKQQYAYAIKDTGMTTSPVNVSSQETFRETWADIFKRWLTS